MVNAKTIGESSRFRDPDRSVQEADFTKLQHYLDLFRNAVSGQGANRVCSITHDTKKAMIQTLSGFIGITKYLMNHGFQYVLLGSLQSDRIEGEFSVYRHSTGSNLFMASSDVISAFKRRLVKFSGSVLNSIEMNTKSTSLHTCAQTTFDEASLVESAFCVELTTFELYSAAYVAGWLEHKCNDLNFEGDDALLNGGPQSFIEEISRGKLTIPHTSTFEVVRAGLSLTKTLKVDVCC